MKRKILRLHDKLYLKENRYKKQKESFRFLFRILKSNKKFKKKIKVLDVGCSNGELLYGLSKRFSNFELTGLDVDSELINKAKEHNSKEVNFIRKDISKKKINLKKKYDLIICAGVLAIFDDCKNVLTNLKNHLNKNGEILLFGNFNTYNYNVFIKYQDLEKNKNILQSGWNIWSLKSIKKIFKNKNIKKYRFIINKKIKRKKNDNIRSWTVTVDGTNCFINGLSVLQNQFWLRIF